MLRRTGRMQDPQSFQQIAASLSQCFRDALLRISAAEDLIVRQLFDGEIVGLEKRRVWAALFAGRTGVVAATCDKLYGNRFKHCRASLLDLALSMSKKIETICI